MKIIRIVTELDYGGVETVIELAAEGLQRSSEVSVEVWALSKDGQVAKNLKAKGVPVYGFHMNPKIPNFSLFRKLVVRLKNAKPDVVHTAGAEANFHGLLAAWWARVPVRIGEEIGFPNHHSLWELIFKATYLCAHKVVAISEAVKSVLVQKGEVKEQKVKVIYNPAQVVGVENEVIKDESEFIFLMVCRLEAVKNIRSVLVSLSNIIHGTPYEPYLKVIGEGSEMEPLRLLVKKLEIENYVAFEGYQREMTHYLGKADVFMIPSFSEGSSVALVEAMMAGLPSIVTQVGGTLEMIGKSESSILVDPHNQQTIENAMLQFLQMEENQRKEMGIRAKEESKKFTVENHVNNLMGLYSSLLEKPSLRGA